MKKRITRKMRRELKNAVNPLEELLIIMKQYFPKLTNWIDNLTDTRHQSYVTYDFKICLLVFHKSSIVNILLFFSFSTMLLPNFK